MKRYMILFMVSTIFILFYSGSFSVNAQDTCDARIRVHYHRHNEDYDNMEIYVYNYGGEPKTIQANGVGAFGQVYEVSVCPNASDKIGVVFKNKGSWDYKDGIDKDNQGGVDDKLIDVTSIRGTEREMEVFVIQGSSEVIYREYTKPTYFGRPNTGNVVVVYYNPYGNEGWDDFWTWDTGTDTPSNVLLEYRLGIDGGNNPNLFKVGIINVASDAEDQVGIMMRKNKTWDEKDTSWINDLMEDYTDEFGHTYKKNGERLINVTDVKGMGYKFIYMIHGVSTIYEDFNQFIADAFPLEITKAEFKNRTEISITFNQAINYDPAKGPDKTRFTLIEEDDNEEIPIVKINYNNLKNSDTSFNLIIGKEEDIEADENYLLIYTYEHLGKKRQIQTYVTFTEGLFSDDFDDEFKKNMTPYLVAGSVAFVSLGLGTILLFKPRKVS